MVDQRGRDSPPIFYISPQLAGYKYHAVLTEVLNIPSKLVLDVWDPLNGDRQTQGVSVRVTAGIYGFQRIEDRDKFCNRCNAIAEVTEYKVAFPVTVPILKLEQPMVTAIRYQPATEPVARKETSNDSSV